MVQYLDNNSGFNNWNAMRQMQKKSKREVLVKSFQELAAHKPINKITIANITANCMVSPPTFYNYFRDNYDSKN